MAELRRLLIDPSRLRDIATDDRLVVLKSHEAHYLRRVLRLQEGSRVNVVDGCGNIWDAKVCREDLIRLETSFDNPLYVEKRPKTLLCLGVVVPKRGFDDVLRMSCEIGIDILQPLTSQYQVAKEEKTHKILRWSQIIREAVEQSERLWIPELRNTLEIKDWLETSSLGKAKAIAVSRSTNSLDLFSWMQTLPESIDQVWIVIGPEGGWSPKEESQAKTYSCESVQLGKTILRTSTAAIVASQIMVLGRDSNPALGK